MELKYWLILNNANLSSIINTRLLQRFGGASLVCNAKAEELAACGLNENAISKLHYPDEDLLKRQLHWSEQKNQCILALDNSLYPGLLKNIPDPPPVLFIRGNPGLLERPQIAIVGSRNPSPGGLRAASEFASELAKAGWVITSGLALGIDAAGHRAALNCGGTTIAVLGSGLDRIYPAKHAGLAEEIGRTGALISEFSPEVPPLARYFPQRNRVISGLSLGVCVVEATKRSGSLITAKLGLEQGREIFAIPGSIFNPLAGGCHSLIQDGAHLAAEVSDILAVLKQATTAWCIMEPPISRKEELELDNNCHKLLHWVGFEPTPIDRIVQNSGYSVAQAAEKLLNLELNGYIRSVPGGYIRYR
jgi:DNA processing protein